MLVTTFIILYPPYREWILNYVFLRADDARSAAYMQGLIQQMSGIMFTRIGFDGIAVYGAGLKVSMAFLLSVYLLFEKKQTVYFVTTFLLFLGGVYYARTSVLVNLVIFFLFMIFDPKKGLKTKKTVQMITVIFVLTVVSAVIGMQVFSSEIIGWILSFFTDSQARNQYMKLGGFFGEHVFFTRLDTFLAGEGLFANILSAGYTTSDSGFMTMILYAGIFCAASLLIAVYQFCQNAAIGREPWSMSLRWSLMLLFVVFQIKGNSLLYLLPFYLVISFLSSRERQTGNGGF